MLVPITLPEEDVFDEVSQWQAVHHPIEFKLQRQDAQVSMRYQPAGFNTKIKIIGAVPLDVAVGQKIRYFDPIGEYHDFTILWITNNTIHTDGTLTGTVYGGFVVFLARTDYYVQAEVFGIDIYNTYTELLTSNYSTDLKGQIKVNIYEFVRTLAVYENNFNYIESGIINKAVEGEGGRYAVRWFEYYNGALQQTSNLEQVRYWVNAAKQIGDLYGDNMAEYVPTADATRVDPDRAKFLTVFEKPTRFEGFPFSLSFIYSDNLTNLQITREEDHFDVNDISVNTESDNLDISYRFAVNRLNVSDAYPSDAESFDIWLESGSEYAGDGTQGENEYADGVFEEVAEEDVEETFRPVKPFTGKYK